MALSAAATIAWTTPTGATGSASWASGASVTIPAGSRVTVALTTPSAAASMSVSFTSDNLSWLGLGGTVPAALAFAFMMPLAPSAVRMTVSVDGLPPNNNATASAVGSIVYYTAGTWVNGAAQGVDMSGLSDAAPALTAIWAACTNSGQGLWLPKGTPLLATVVTVPANGKLRCAGIDQTVFTSTIAPGPALNCAFLGTDTYGVSGTLHTTPTLYGDTLTSSTSVPIYSWVEIGSALPTTTLYVEIFQITGVAGPVAGVYTYTLDRAIERPFKAGDSLLNITVPLVGVEMSDFSIGGTGTRAIDLIGAIRSKCHDIVIGPDAAGNYFGEGGSFDTGGFENEWRNVRVIGGGVMNHGLLHESACRAVTVDCSTDYCNTGQLFFDCIDSEVRNPRGDGNTSKVYIGGDSALTVGSLNCRSIGGSGASNAQDYEVGNSTGTSIVAPGSNGSTLCGVLIEGTNTTTGRAFDVSITGGTIEAANSSGVTTGGGIVLVNTAGVAINGVAINAPLVAGLTTSGTAVTDVSGNLGTVRGVVASGGRQAGILQQVAGATGKLVGPVIDTAAYAVYFDTGGTFSRFVIDKVAQLNLSSGLVANGIDGIVNGAFYKVDGATSVDVRDVQTVICNDSGATTVTQPMLNAFDGQAVDYLARTGYTTVDRSNAYLAGGANWVSTSTQAGAATLGLVYQGALTAAVERYRVNTNQ